MWPESSESPQPLRTGLTTGSCATACALACAELLLGQQRLDKVKIKLPQKSGRPQKLVELSLAELEHLSPQQALASTIKDAGDDPDVTHGAKLSCQLSLLETPGIRYKAGTGVGTVTKPGLTLGVGEPAINPVPRQMIGQHLEDAAKRYGYDGGFEVEIGIENGEQLALKTMNGRLGIVGGLSVLGTSGIVRPFSCAAWIASIHQGIDVARAQGLEHLGASTGNNSEAFLRQQYQLEDTALLEMGDFAGAVLKHLKQHPVKRLSLAGGFGKLSKLACGHMDLHSRASSIDFQYLAQAATKQGAKAELIEQILAANTSIEALKLCQAQRVDLAQQVCLDAWSQASKRLPTDIQFDLWAVNRQGQQVGCYSAKV